MDTAPEPIVPGATNPLRWFGLDLACVVVFTIVGMVMHGSPAGEFVLTAWPFVLGLAIAWALPGVRSLPLILWPTGVIVWAVTTVVGLGLRAVTGGGVSGAFPFVTAGVLAVLILGWRGVLEIKERRHERQARYL
ncbi:DUF3054 domain-containing protein [Georgenia sp. EYE_87]|uniref:DUF3054 domain-containing protein n=1 Tax=Georgenia sp. EYE_87 TaxID=2853448 RepID=UPI0020041D43|nr:DUF3054 domain-containing protein [Georgenia sp. EYE_87]MCK6210504.1 DUF3054 domain-containing protein [Georgenia sp. EYE_87]